MAYRLEKNSYFNTKHFTDIVEKTEKHRATCRKTIFTVGSIDSTFITKARKFCIVFFKGPKIGQLVLPYIP